MIKVLLLVLSLIPINAMAGSCPRLSESQYSVLQYSYEFGKSHDMGWTLAAIAWQESSAGEFRVNLAGPAFGTYQILLSTASKRLGLESSFEENRLAQRLIYDDQLGAYLAIRELQFWYGVHDGNWSFIWASYYAGYDTVSGVEYANDIRSKIGTLQSCGIIQT